MLPWALGSSLLLYLCFFPVAWGWLAFYLLTGTVMLLALGMILAGVVLNMARHGMFLSEALAGAMYLVCGVVFPLGKYRRSANVPGEQHAYPIQFELGEPGVRQGQ